MKDSEIYNRTQKLKHAVNVFLQSVTGTKYSYYDDLTTEDLMSFKKALADINNVLTLKTTLVFTNWLAEYFTISMKRKEELLKHINSTKPNTNGFDIELNSEKIIAEIKCIVPINGGDSYGAAQRNSILDDAIKLDKGKRRIKQTKDFIKIIGLIDLGERTNTAIQRLKTEAKKIRTKQQVRIARHEIVKKIVLLEDKMQVGDLDTGKIYIKMIKLEE